MSHGILSNFLIVKTLLTLSFLSGGFCSLGAGINKKGTHFCRADMVCSFGLTKISLRTMQSLMKQLGRMALSEKWLKQIDFYLKSSVRYGLFFGPNENVTAKPNSH